MTTPTRFGRRSFADDSSTPESLKAITGYVVTVDHFTPVDHNAFLDSFIAQLSLERVLDLAPHIGLYSDDDHCCFIELMDTAIGILNEVRTTDPTKEHLSLEQMLITAAGEALVEMSIRGMTSAYQVCRVI